MNNVKVNTMFDKGSLVSLANSKLKRKVITPTNRRVASPPVKLCGVDGKELKTLGCFEIPQKVGNRHMTHKILSIDNLQIGCILGVDLMSHHNIIIVFQFFSSLFRANYVTCYR